jgi:SAM-dependent methyltransferase
MMFRWRGHSSVPASLGAAAGKIDRAFGAYGSSQVAHSTLWSWAIQGILALNLSREARFQDDRKDLLLRLLRLRPGIKVLEVGCGPGALAQKLARWLGPSSDVIGLDRDSGVGTFGPDLAGLPALFQELGFTEVQVDAIALPVVPDDARHAPEYRKWLIESEWREQAEADRVAAVRAGQELDVELVDPRREFAVIVRPDLSVVRDDYPNEQVGDLSHSVFEEILDSYGRLTSKEKLLRRLPHRVLADRYGNPCSQRLYSSTGLWIKWVEAHLRDRAPSLRTGGGQ